MSPSPRRSAAARGPASRSARTVAATLFTALSAAALAAALFTAAPAGAAAQASCTYRSRSDIDAPAGRISDLDYSDISLVTLTARLNDAGQQHVINVGREGTGAGDGNLTIESDAGTDSPQVALSGDGQVMLFTSTGNPTGGNADGNRELFRYESGGDVVQVTDTTGGGTQAHLLPSLDDDGDRGVLLSNRSYGSNADGNLEVVRITGGTSLSQLTTTTGTVHGTRPDITPDGLTVVWGSRADLAGSGNGDGTPEVFRFTDGALLTLQLTHTTDGTVLPSPSISRNRDVAFELDTEELTSTNPEGNTELFLLHSGGDVEQLTTTTGGASTHPDLNPAGTVIGFTSTSAIGGPNPGLLPFPMRWARTGGLIRVSPVAAAGDPASTRIDGAGGTLGYRSTVDEQGFNDDGSLEAIRYDCRTFSDVEPDHTFWRDVEWMSAEGITTGFGDGTYKPAQAVSRQAMSAFMYRLQGEPDFDPPSTPTFPDVPASSAFFTEIEWMNAEGITTGFPNGTFKPFQAVSRAAMSAFMYRMEEASYPPPSTAHFTDVPLGHPFITEIEWMADNGITTGFGDGTFRPQQAVTRQAMSAFMHRLAVPQVALT